MEEELLNKIKKISDEINTSNAIAIIGAGASFESGMPLAGQLSPFLWQTIDKNTEAKQILTERLGIANDSGKNIINDKWDRILQAFKVISEIPEARKYFQNIFSSLNKDRSERVSEVYESLARLIHDGYIELVISLNWDTLLETSWKKIYGVEINFNEKLLFKPHGSANNPNVNWLLPHQTGNIDTDLKMKISSFVEERPRLLLVIGYSEQDDKVVDELIQPLENSWRIVRINPSCTQDLNIPLPASEAISKMIEYLYQGKRKRVWYYETFANQRGLEAAIAGHKLGPKDIEVCPKLPQVRTALNKIDIHNVIEITGSSGCGKSITSFQVAHKLMLKGYEVLRVIDRGVSEESLLIEAKKIRRKSVLLLDDAHQFSTQFREQLKEQSSKKLKIIISLTDTSDTYPQSIRIERDEAVKTLAENFISNIDQVLPIVKKFDDHVGKRYLDIPLSRRIKEAKDGADSPWQFNFILRGGWRNAKDEIGAVKDLNRADVLLTIIALEQILSLDSTVSENRLKVILKDIGFEKRWVSESMDALEKRKLIITDSDIRCPHIRFAVVVLNNFYGSIKDEYFESINAFISKRICNKKTPLQGISWLLKELRFTNAFRFRIEDKIITNEVWEKVIGRCLNQSNHIERNFAAITINSMCVWVSNGYELIGSHSEIIVNWIEQINEDSALGISHLLNGLINNNEELLKAIVLEADSALVAEKISTTTPKGGYAIGEFLGRLSFGVNDDWVSNFKDSLKVTEIISTIESSTSDDLFYIAKFIEGISYYHEELAYDLLDESLPIIKIAFEENPLSNWENIRDLLSRFLGLPVYFKEPNQNVKQIKYSKSIASFIPTKKIANKISNSSQRDWERYSRLIGWISQINTDKVREIGTEIDLGRLDSKTQGLWNCPPRELRLLISSLGYGLEEKKVLNDWVESHIEEIKTIDPLIGYVCPHATIKIISRGGELDLFGHNGSNWELCIAVIHEIHKIDAEIIPQILKLNVERIAKTLSTLEKIDCTEPLINFLNFLKEGYPDLLKKILKNIDLTKAQKNWPQRYEGNEIEKKVAITLIEISSNLNSDLKIIEREFK